MQPQQLRQLSRHLVRQLGMLNNQCGTFALTPVQAHTLIELEQGPCSVNQMAILLKVDKSNASRNLAMLLNQDLITTISHPTDRRSQLSQLTTTGHQVLQQLHHQLNLNSQQILEQLDDDEIQCLAKSLHRYSRAITATEQQQQYNVRSITPLDNAAIATIIRNVSMEYGLTSDKGYGFSDPTLDNMAEIYQPEMNYYWVIEKDHHILGGGGIAALAGQDGWCELQKMYFLPELRGKGFARKIAVQALKFARQQGYKGCYLETTAVLKEAVDLYLSLGFVEIPQRMGNTGHGGCEIKMIKTF
ncbi:MarR family transcriptional regulator [Photobacterium sp. NCIMB 13483]|uniref:bifunctional helix-turn-helix transcriptional regulator/GNAT family N-acetyltransferase n=1 Tax=Photobacterium sp. NCIMB 13483 TaxID=2022103 RepID=UPI000D177EA4|nr:bifunctional helix-turn-helix transcriptional regulator/GNAT family N-acetyltransferase [Photobacterium sp. NCIMB 13483]PST88167.1 MarR family transcriptional regulator [Photobacterium sp. NCIMB 13483]